MIKTIIGIIGGAGVAATNKLNSMIEEYFTKNGAFRDCHHPEIITYQAVNVPSRSIYLEGKGESFIPGYVDIADKLKFIGANVLCMSCNTAHYAIAEIQKEVGLPFINVIEAVVNSAKEKGYKKVGIMASDGCLLGKVYENAFEKSFPGAELIYPNPERQKDVTRGICNIKNKSRFLAEDHPDRPKVIFTQVCDHLYEQGAEIIISGCTDIAVDFLPQDYHKLPIIDSLTVLAERICFYVHKF
jgi:aspartate racemase